MHGFQFNEKYLSQIPALKELITLGYEYLSSQKALIMRDGKSSNILLEGILREQLLKLNRIHYKEKYYQFSEDNIRAAIQKLKNVKYDGLQNTSEKIYDLITLGTTLKQTIEESSKSFNLNYIDWKNTCNNTFHVVPQYAIERSHSIKTIEPNIVLFVNGIPLAVIECTSPGIAVEEAVFRHMRNQGNKYIPKLFTYIQLVIAVNKNAAQYATVGTSEKFWAIWRECEDQENEIASLVNTALSEEQACKLFSGDFAITRFFFDSIENEGKRIVTEQDKILYSLCRPKRLLELTYRFMLFDAGSKKIARYQQFFVIGSIMSRIRQRDRRGNRTGGVIWHTQGSGKSLTMIMLTRALALDTEITNPRIILVTDRDDLDKQLGNNFTACGLVTKRATSSRNLVKHLKEKVGIITTLIHKFDKGWTTDKHVDASPDIFVLVDESHRTNFGSLADHMRRMLPNACYLGFTGTPLLTKEKNNFSKFGGLIHPHYSIKQAVKDKAVVSLLYEGRNVEIEQKQSTIDLWFERHTSDLSKEQQDDLKRKYAHAKMLNKLNHVVYMRAFDISEHYRANWQGTGFKAQLIAPSKGIALKYHEYLKEIGFVTSEIIISAPDKREKHKDIDSSIYKVSLFWDKMMKLFGSEEEYTKQIIHQFKYSETPEILIIVNKLLTGFDAPKNTVLYLCRTLREHTLLQAIARVNRLHEGKDFGYIVDYANVLGELDKSLTMYDAFEGFDEDDLIGVLTSVNKEVQRLPQLYSDLWDVFREIKNKHDQEEFEGVLSDDELRAGFYERLTDYSKTLGIALSTEKFIMKTGEEKLRRYKRDLKYFHNLKVYVKSRYAESMNCCAYEPKIKKMLDMHIPANEIIQLNKAVDIFNNQNFDAITQGQGIYSGKSTAAKADTIAHATKKVICEKMDEDPAFYAKFSNLVQQAIDDFKRRKVSDLNYLDQVSSIRNKIVLKCHGNMPNSINVNDEACAYYGVIQPYYTMYTSKTRQIKTVAIKTSLAIQQIMNKHWKVDFWTDDTAMKSAINAIDDFLYDEVKVTFNMALSCEHMDEIIEKTMQIAKSRKH